MTNLQTSLTLFLTLHIQSSSLLIGIEIAQKVTVL